MDDDNDSPRLRSFLSEYLQKRESDKKWIKYWVVLRGQFMVFYSEKCNGDRDHLRGFIEISPGTKCLITERRKYHFPFFMTTGRAKYYFKCPSAVRRHEWICAINVASKAMVEVFPPAQENFGLDQSPVHNPLENPIDTVSPGDVSTDSSDYGRNDLVDAETPPMTDSDPTTWPDTNQPRIIVVESTSCRNETTNFMSEHNTDEANRSISLPETEYSSTSSMGSLPKQRTMFKLSKNQDRLLTFRAFQDSCNLARPSTSPERRTSGLFKAPIRVGNQLNAMSFSRHLVASAPDLQRLTIEDT